MSDREEEIRDSEQALAASAATLLEQIRAHVRSQKDLWNVLMKVRAGRRMLHLDGPKAPTGQNFWKTIAIDLQTGELHWPFNFGGDWQPAHPQHIIQLAVNPDQIMATNYLTEATLRAHGFRSTKYLAS